MRSYGVGRGEGLGELLCVREDSEPNKFGAARELQHLAHVPRARRAGGVLILLYEVVGSRPPGVLRAVLLYLLSLLVRHPRRPVLSSGRQSLAGDAELSDASRERRRREDPTQGLAGHAAERDEVRGFAFRVHVANVEVVEGLHIDEVLGLAHDDASVRDPSLESRAEGDAPRRAAF